MKHLLQLVVVAFVLGSLGCGKKASTQAEPCEPAIGAAIDAMLSTRKAGAAPDQMTEIANKLRTVMTTRCKADGWPPEALACYRAATDQPGIRKCREQLPKEQAQRLQMEILKVMSGGGRPGGFRGGTGGPPHGGPGGGPPTGGSASDGSAGAVPNP